MAWKFDFLIVGAGFSGLTMAERIATRLRKSCLIVEKRPHIGGNSHDFCDPSGVLVHSYGPHYFRTNNEAVRNYLSQFTAWHPVNYKILSFTEGRYWQFPVNLNTFEQYLGRPSSSEEMEDWLAANCQKIEHPKNSEDFVLSKVGSVFYEKFFKGYTTKQWACSPKELDASVCARIPVRTNRDDRYLNENFQAMPKNGYTALFEKMLEAARPFVEVMTETDFAKIAEKTQAREVIYTGPIDEFFRWKHGRLPYRSLRFESESFTAEALLQREKISGKKGLWQPAVQVNYPGEEAFTRIVEIKHATGQQCESSTVVREYPQDCTGAAEPYYPICSPGSEEIFQKYRAMAAPLQTGRDRRVSFVGRLANYRYFNMDQVVGIALHEFQKLEKRHREK